MTNNVNLAALESDLRFRADEKALHELLVRRALECGRGMAWAPGTTSQHFSQRLKMLRVQMDGVATAVQTSKASIHVVGEEHVWLRENLDLLRSEAAQLQDATEGLSRTEHVRGPGRELAPRVLVIAEDLMSALNYVYSDTAFRAYMRAFQTAVVLRVAELRVIAPALKLVLLERVAARVLNTTNAKLTDEKTISNCIKSLREIDQAPWQELVESLIVFDEVLRTDPAGAYARMDETTRETYRSEVVKLAEHSDHSELEIAEMVVALAKQSLVKHERDPRLAQRRSHVGYYLLAEGRDQLYHLANVRLPWRDRFQAFLRRHPDEFYPFGVEILTLSMILAILWSVPFMSLWGALLAALALLIPCSQAAVEIMNYLTTSLLDPQLLPKLDYSEGVPEECTTMVVVPTLLFNETQVRQLVRELEVRYVGNMSANVHFALLTDLPDSAEQPREDDPLVDLCGDLIRGLNQKYAGKGGGTFAMFHRHRIYNRREGVWIGWERKRGKLLDFNRFILGEYDSFPYKVCDLSILLRVRYVLTLDSDTQLPRGAAHRLIGTIAHPLCQAVIDKERNIVTQGYGILQPRVGISVQSTSQSRLASIYSDWTGFDIYTRAVSDVYQDLYGEGSFVGKGIYELRTVHSVLDRRFPRNAILSHDLIEGAYARAGLATDIKVIDFYPSHYSAYARRKHRWVRGDWQNVEWMFSRVPDDTGRRVRNPISLISRWKIMDNLRRSMVEPATLAAFILAWTVLPGRPLFWTLALMGILFASTIFQFFAALVRAAASANFRAMKYAFPGLVRGGASVLLSFGFLMHDALLSTDAIWRSIYRRFVSRERLLQWETAAEAESGKKKRTPVDMYLVWTPAIVLGIGAALFFGRRHAFWVAAPILLAWGCSKMIATWLDRPALVPKRPQSRKDELFLRRSSLRTWRYFAEYSTAEHNWLIPDNVYEEGGRVAARLSPTNLGFLLNARQVACELGYLTVPELAELTRHTLDSMNRLELYRGHLFNWYDTRTLAALPPRFVSTVDNGNLAASLLTLQHGCRELLDKPLLSNALLDGYDDHVRALAELKAVSWWTARRALHARKGEAFLKRVSGLISDALLEDDSKPVKKGAAWFGDELRLRRSALRTLLRDYTPWLMPEFDSVARRFELADSANGVSLAKLPRFIRELELRIQEFACEGSGSEQDREECRKVLALLPQAYLRATNLVQTLNQLVDEAQEWFNRMDFSFLLDRRRKLLSIGYSVEAGELHKACYDLLASEARIAAFIAIAKGEIPQDVWFKLGRKPVATSAGTALISWTGTMFEYLMPAIWMRAYPDSLLEGSMQVAVRTQQAYAAEKDVPWGISESGFSELDPDGVYGYRAFGVPEMAMQTEEEERVVIAPYATAMAVPVDPEDALRNLRRMANRGWLGACGFYESADYGPVDARFRNPKMVKEWMAHHQGMSLLAIANFLCDDVVRRWFHSDVYVEATELLLQERMSLPQPKRTRRVRREAIPSSRSSVVHDNAVAVES
jgi:cyclic beta-1,2-glucan synthetase